MNNKKLEEWREAARRKAEEIDRQFELRQKVSQGINAAGDAVRKASESLGETINEATSTAREQASRIDEQYGVGEKVRQGARAATENAEGFARAAEETAKDVFGAASTYYRRAEQAYNVGAGGARLTEAALSSFEKARAWAREHPGQAAVVTLSLIAGVRSSAALPQLGVTILGAGGAGNWFFHSALPIVGMRKLTERYEEYLKGQEARLARGEIEEAERGRIEFQRRLTKYVGAPLLGAFSVAAGATLIGAAFSGATVSGLPVSLLLGANPLLNGIWFFANGVICISEGYRFFMIALADQEEVARVVREIRGLLPA
jgi:hypothetical protein